MILLVLTSNPHCQKFLAKIVCQFCKYFQGNTKKSRTIATNYFGSMRDQDMIKFKSEYSNKICSNVQHFIYSADMDHFIE